MFGWFKTSRSDGVTTTRSERGVSRSYTNRMTKGLSNTLTKSYSPKRSSTTRTQRNPMSGYKRRTRSKF